MDRPEARDECGARRRLRNRRARRNKGDRDHLAVVEVNECRVRKDACLFGGWRRPDVDRELADARDAPAFRGLATVAVRVRGEPFLPGFLDGEVELRLKG